MSIDQEKLSIDEEKLMANLMVAFAEACDIAANTNPRRQWATLQQQITALVAVGTIGSALATLARP